MFLNVLIGFNWYVRWAGQRKEKVQKTRYKVNYSTNTGKEGNGYRSNSKGVKPESTKKINKRRNKRSCEGRKRRTAKYEKLYPRKQG